MSRILYTNRQIRELERIASERFNIAPAALMQRAGEAALMALCKHFPRAQKIIVVCGAGNNAGDGYVLATLAAQQGLQVKVAYLTPPAELTGIAADAAQACQHAGVATVPFTVAEIDSADLIVDAILGTGLSRDVDGVWRKTIAEINQANIPVMALDVPSGMNVDTGCCMGIATQAQLTITFIGLKPGLLTGHGPAYCGKVICDDLTIPEAAFTEVQCVGETITATDIAKVLTPRRRDTYKSQCGHVLVIGGDYGMAGAVRMSAEAAARVGAGLVSVATHPEHMDIVNNGRPELMCREVAAKADLYGLLAKVDVVILGPGLGRSSWGRELFDAVMMSRLPMVIDADGLNLLAEKKQHRDHWILTPHAGEAARLLRYSAKRVQADRFAAIAELQHHYGGVSVLKGSGSLIRGLEDKTYLCRAGNPGMATGGMGDVLSGVIGGLLAQGLTPLDAARAGVWVHATAADQAVAKQGERGLLATDLMPYIRHLVNPS